MALDRTDAVGAGGRSSHVASTRIASAVESGFTTADWGGLAPKFCEEEAVEIGLLGDIAVKVADTDSIGIGESGLTRDGAHAVGALCGVGKISGSSVGGAVVVGGSTVRDVAVIVACADSIVVGKASLARNRADSVCALGRVSQVSSTSICSAVVARFSTAMRR